MCWRLRKKTGGGTQFVPADIRHLCLVLNIASSDFKNISACAFQEHPIEVEVCLLSQGKSHHQ